MAVVKGSKQEKMIVVPYRPRQPFAIRAAILFSMLVVGIGFYYFGHYQGVNENSDARMERDLLLLEADNNSSEINLLRQEVVNLEQAGAINQQALNEVQGTIVGLRDEIVQLEEDRLFYKQVMSPENNEMGLTIGQLDLFGAEGESTIRYRVEIKQLGNNNKFNFVSGFANVNVVGLQDGEQVSFPLHSLSTTEDQLDIKLQFRYFQNIEGELILPDNLIPSKIEVLAVAEGSNLRSIQKSFSWIVER